MKKLIGKVLEYVARLTGNYDLRRLAWDLQRNPRPRYEVAKRQQVASGYRRSIAERKPAIIYAAGKVGISEYDLNNTKHRTQEKANSSGDILNYMGQVMSMQKEIDDMSTFINSDGGKNDNKSSRPVVAWKPSKERKIPQQDMER